MKFTSVLVALSTTNLLVTAFPLLENGHLHGLTHETLHAAIRSVDQFKQEKRFIIDISKPIDITGKHVFEAPKKDDQRGPCPGLNALANHGYIARSGITSFAEVVTAINQGMCTTSHSKRVCH
jgi:hypothetical protein